MEEPVRGVVYVSRVPPYMTVQQLKQHLSIFGEVTRVYLAAEDKSVTKQRRKLHGNGRRKFEEGWVEFASVRQAKDTVTALNNMPIGGKKRSKFHDDLWNLKFLQGFNWTQISEKIAYEKAVRDQKIRTEMSQSKREQKFYAARVNQSKQIAAMSERKKRKRGHVEEPVLRTFKQRVVKEGPLVAQEVLDKVLDTGN